uniref:Protein kinase domain-containing protein n=1 Tax=Rhizophagus irregularis (strain DAOM 181602 / DAOM 197198 / MUCL 43194) TaxID=747089 RepID=U9TUH6_RHIID
MWELMTGRKPFWGQNHDAELIIEICDGLRPPIVTNAPEGYVELMQEYIGPITNNPGAVYKSRPLSAMISSAESTRSLRSQSISLKFDKRKFNDSLLEEKINKKVKLFENENNDYLTTELELDIDNNIQSSNNDYITEEINLDIDTRCGLNF